MFRRRLRDGVNLHWILWISGVTNYMHLAAGDG
ncbi:hypothetical protein LTSEBAI_1751, partial [Salmonella enterica subsp. enterica serovar Baildon str. R6-199]